MIFLEAKNPAFWLTFCSFSLVQLSIIFIFNYQKLPPYLRNDFYSTLTFPVYKNIDNAMSHIAFWRAILFSIPVEPETQSNLEKIDQGKIPPLQLAYSHTKTVTTPLQQLNFHRTTHAPKKIQLQSLRENRIRQEEKSPSYF